MPVPIAVMIVRISSFLRILSIRARSTLRILPRSGRIAWNARSRPCLADAAGRVALDEVELAERGIVERAVGQLARAAPTFSSADFLRVRSRALRAASRARAALTAFSMMARATGGCSSRYVAEMLVDDRLDDALDLGVAELGLGLPLELRLAHLDGQHAGEPFADVVAGQA